MSRTYDRCSHSTPHYQHHPHILPKQREGYVPGNPQSHEPSSENCHQAHQQIDDCRSNHRPAQTSPKVRKRGGGAAGEYVKHRRTRSGCFTCRGRRVKCDETHPVCERCLKGKRECVYPDPNASKLKLDWKTFQLSQLESTSSGDDSESKLKDDHGDVLETIPDDEDSKESAERFPAATSHCESAALPDDGRGSQTPSLDYGNSPTPSADGSAYGGNTSRDPSLGVRAAQNRLAGSLAQSKRWADLPKEVLFYLNYHHTNISHFHYAFKFESDDFLKTTFLDMASRSEPLLYAIVGFSAYLYSVSTGEGKIHDFLSYYNKAVTLLRASLINGQRPNVATLLTILQLATIEARRSSSLHTDQETNSLQEYLGDWVSALTHARAALKLLTTFYTPESAMADDMGRKVLTWYIRFDLVAGMISGQGTFLARDWYVTRHEHYLKFSQENKSDITGLYLERFSHIALLCADAATLWSKRCKATIDPEEFLAKSNEINQKLTNWEARVNPLLMDSSKFIKDFSGAPPRNPDDIVDPYQPNFMYGGDLWGTNLMKLDWWAFELMYKQQLCKSRGDEPGPELAQTALKMLHMFASIQLYPNKPLGVLISAQSTVGVACIFMPKDERHTLWSRKKLATIEALGYTFSKKFREKMSDHWNIDVRHWWLPNDEGFPRFLRTIRSIVLDRDDGPPRDQISEDLREMRGIFFNISLVDSGTSPSPSSESGSVKGRENAESVNPRSQVLATTTGMNMGMGMDWSTNEAFKHEESPHPN